MNKHTIAMGAAAMLLVGCNSNAVSSQEAQALRARKATVERQFLQAGATLVSTASVAGGTVHVIDVPSRGLGGVMSTSCIVFITEVGVPAMSCGAEGEPRFLDY